MLSCCTDDGFPIFKENAEVGRSEREVVFFPHRIEIAARADGSDYYSYTEPNLEHMAPELKSVQLATQGSSTFTLDSAGLFDLSWTSQTSGWAPFNTYLLLKSAAGDPMFACAGYNPDGCSAIIEPEYAWQSDFYFVYLSPTVTPDLRVGLPAGAYEFLFFASGEHAAGVTVGSSFTFSMTEVVPLPTSIALLGSGLLPLLVNARRAR